MPPKSLSGVDKLVTLQCRLSTGVESFLVVFQGCYDAISGPANTYASGVAWFGFAILCWTVSTYYLPLFPLLFSCCSTPSWVEGDDRTDAFKMSIDYRHSFITNLPIACSTNGHIYKFPSILAARGEELDGLPACHGLL